MGKKSKNKSTKTAPAVESNTSSGSENVEKVTGNSAPTQLEPESSKASPQPADVESAPANDSQAAATPAAAPESTESAESEKTEGPDTRGSSLVPDEVNDIVKEPSTHSVNNGSGQTSKSLEALCERQAAQIKTLAEQLDAAEGDRDDIQDQYDELLEKVSHIKTTLGARLKADAADLAKCKVELEKSQLETSNAVKAQERAEHEVVELKKELYAHKESSSSTEKKSAGRVSELEKELAEMRRQLDTVSREKTSFELQLGDERSTKDQLESKLAQLSEEVASQTGFAERYRETSVNLESKLAKSQAENASKAQEWEDTEAAHVREVQSLKSQHEQLSKDLANVSDELAQTKAKTSDYATLQNEIKEKNLQIGKLRHEAVILNEHLTNSLRLVRKNSQGQSIDKDLISNLVIQFATLPRGDTKKFEVLQLISNCLGWDEERQVQAGLSRSSRPGSQPENVGGLFGKFAEFLERESGKK